MPRKGFHSITISKKTYDKFEPVYNKLNDLDKIPSGINSFSGYVTHRMENSIKEKEILNKLAGTITNVPKTFTEKKHVIKVTI